MTFAAPTSYSQAVLKNNINGKIISLPTNQKISFQLHSDSLLQTEISDDYGILQTYTDSALVLDDGRHIKFNDFKFIRIHPKERYKAQMIASSFVVIGSAIALRGVVMVFGEGLESKNKVSAPLHLVIGGAITAIASYPFWGLPKKYILDQQNWTLGQP